MSHADKHPPKQPPKSLTDRVREFAALRVDERMKDTIGLRMVMRDVTDQSLETSAVGNLEFLKKHIDLDGVLALVERAYEKNSSAYKDLENSFGVWVGCMDLMREHVVEKFPCEDQRDINGILAGGPKILDGIIDALKWNLQDNMDRLAQFTPTGQADFKDARKETEAGEEWKGTKDIDDQKELLEDWRALKERELNLGGHDPEEAKEAAQQFTPFGDDADLESVQSLLISGKKFLESQIALFQKIKSDYERIVMPGLGKGWEPGKSV